jgi:hypothetical protein
MFAVAGNDTRKFKYTISTSTRTTRRAYEGNAKQVALSFSLAFSPFLSLFEEENDDFTTTFIIISITVVSTTRL